MKGLGVIMSRHENRQQCRPTRLMQAATPFHLGILTNAPSSLSVQRSLSVDHNSYLTWAIMSNLPSSSSSHSNLDAIFDAALRTYKKQTGKDITAHPLATELQSCNSPDAILALLRRQLPTLDQSQSGDKTFTKCLIPTVNVLHTLSKMLGKGVWSSD